MRPVRPFNKCQAKMKFAMNRKHGQQMEMELDMSWLQPEFPHSSWKKIMEKRNKKKNMKNSSMYKTKYAQKLSPPSKAVDEVEKKEGYKIRDDWVVSGN